MPRDAAEPRGRFWRIGTAGVFFRGGAAAVDTGSMAAALVHGLAGSTATVGAAAAISRYGWLFPQLFVAYFAQRRRRRLPFYTLGAFGRVGCLAGVLALAEGKPTDGRPSLRYLALLHAGARAHGVPEHWLRSLDGVQHAEGWPRPFPWVPPEPRPRTWMRAPIGPREARGGPRTSRYRRRKLRSVW